MQTCYECNWQQLTFDEDEHLSDDPQPECEILATTKSLREEKNCERKQEFKETMSIMAITKLEGGDLVMMEGVKLIYRFGNHERWQWTMITHCKYNKPQIKALGFWQIFKCLSFFLLYNLQPTVGLHIWAKFRTQKKTNCSRKFVII